MIRVIGNYAITVDANNYMAGKSCVRKDKKGNDYNDFEPFGYYRTFQQALSAVRERLRKEAVKDIDGTLEEACRAIQASDEEFKKLVEIAFGSEVGA